METDFLTMSEEQWQALIDSAPDDQPDVDEPMTTEAIQNLLTKEGHDKRHAMMVEQMEGRCLKFADTIANRFISHEKTMFYLWGIRGTGKTQIAARVAFCMKRASIGVGRRVLVSGYLKDLKASYQGTVEQKQDIRRLTKRLETAPLLILDEITEMKGSEYNQEELNRIVDKRYGNMLPTLIIGNDEPDAAREILGASIWSRLMETGGCIHADWDSYRTGGQQ